VGPRVLGAERVSLLQPKVHHDATSEADIALNSDVGID